MKTSYEKEQKFRIFHEENPEVYDLFKRFCYEAMDKGHTRLSAEMIINRIRWETKIVTTDRDYKINNDYKPFYSRLFIIQHKGYEDFFQLRQSVADYKLGELTPKNVNALSIIQEGEMYTLEDAEFIDTKVVLDEDEINYINEIPNDGHDWDGWMNENGSVLNLGGHIHFD